MRVNKLSANFVRYTDTDLRNKVAFILESKQGNPHFPDSIPTLESIRILFEQYQQALAAAKSYVHEITTGRTH